MQNDSKGGMMADGTERTDERRFIVCEFDLQKGRKPFEEFLNGLPATHDLRLTAPQIGTLPAMVVLERRDNA